MLDRLEVELLVEIPDEALAGSNVNIDTIAVELLEIDI